MGAVAVLGELADAAQELGVGAELVQAGDRADSLAVGGVAAGPGDRDRDAFAAALDGDGDLFDERADELFAVEVGGGGRGPQGGDIAGQGGDGLLLGGVRARGRVRQKRS